ncbi:MAG: hypothetical protein EAZ99_18810 [Alphaproteobacteria bacterium]|nr:MAG: hypothetical protein EAZ99_18810 [Alphaproteobacteria bacterium]
MPNVPQLRPLVTAIALCLWAACGPAQAEDRAGVTSTGPAAGTSVGVAERLGPAAEPRQILFLDRSALSLDPDGEIVVEAFSFDPAQRQGRLAIRAEAGTLRFVGGSLSKTGDVTITTPNAAIALRGGIAFVEVQPNGRTSITLGYGVEATVTGRDGSTARLVQPGETVSVAAEGGVGTPGRAGPAALEALIRRVEGTRAPLPGQR